MRKELALAPGREGLAGDSPWAFGTTEPIGSSVPLKELGTEGIRIGLFTENTEP
jgi:hypothetical protein